jgi:alkanesulfonate monooxygenase SsuD/methylene tetrahydromethanopterin reductase-like flavin-dependent oxidoreductase (luciferase family)
MARPLRVGVQLPEVERVVRWPEIAALARRAEEVGFDSLWVGDHLLYRGDGRPERGPYDAWSVLAGLACCTSRVEIGPLVACALFRPAPLVARAAQAVDEMSGGRLVLGLGCGWNRVEFDAFGIGFEDRVARFEESFEVIRRLLDGERVSFSGRHVEVHDAVLRPVPLRRPRLMVGSNGPRMLAATLPHVDRWNTWWADYGNSVEGYSVLNASISAAAESAGRPPGEIERSACVLVVLDPTSGERQVPPGIVPLEGGPKEIAAELSSYAEAGADEVVLVLSPINIASIEKLGEALNFLDG